MRILTALIVLMTTATAMAQGRPPRSQNRTVDLAYQVADQLYYDIQRVSASQEQAIQTHLNQIKQILNGSNQDGKLVCVSRDNDGRNPWILAYQENPVTGTRFTNAVFDSEISCKSTIENMRPIDSYRQLFCSTRDNDGRDPWQVAIFNSYYRTVSVVPRSSIGNNVECRRAVADARLFGQDIALCTSRDGDGRTPFNAVLYKADGTIEKGLDTFSTYNECAVKLAGSVPLWPM